VDKVLEFTKDTYTSSAECRCLECAAELQNKLNKSNEILRVTYYVSRSILVILANFNRFALNDPKLRSYFPVYTSLYTLIDCLHRFLDHKHLLTPKVGETISK